MKAYSQAEKPVPDMEWLRTTQEYSKLHLKKTAHETFLKKPHFGENTAQKTLYHDKKHHLQNNVQKPTCVFKTHSLGGLQFSGDDPKGEVP